MGFTFGDDPKKISKQNKKIAARIFRETGKRVAFVQSGPITFGVPPALRAFRGKDASPTSTRDISNLGCANCFPNGSGSGTVRGVLGRGKQVQQQSQTGRGRRLTDEELRLLRLRERGLI